MDRRSFFRSAIKKSGDTVGKAVVKAADAKVNKQASRWIRPPFAINELEFLLACTRCHDCIDACSYQVIFSLSAKVGIKAAGTPALDLVNRGCHLCEDWPCVTACVPGALKQPEPGNDGAQTEPPENETPAPPQPKPAPKLARARIDEKACLPYSGPECGACLHSCPVPGALTLDMVRPVINEALCAGCALCRAACITEPKAIDIATL